jgi:aminoglycoside 2'-N-acetyltransferase I
LTNRIEVVDGDAGWALAEPLDRECYPPETMATVIWRDIVWTHADKRVLVHGEGGIVCHVGIYFRDATLDDTPVRIAGIGGVMTSPGVRRAGHAGSAMRCASDAMREHQSDFGLLFCEPHNVALYEQLGWRIFVGGVYCEQPTGRMRFDLMHAMVLPLRLTPAGRVIDLCGLPW